MTAQGKFVEVNGLKFWIDKGPETVRAFGGPDIFSCTRCGHECELETAVMVLGRLHHRVCPTLDQRNDK